MKNIPFFVSTIMAVVCLALSGLYLYKGRSNQQISGDILKQQQDIQSKSQDIALQKQEGDRQQQIIQTGANIAQKLGREILTNIGYFAAKNKNDKLEKILIRQKLDGFIMKPEQVKQIDEQAEKLKAQQGGASAPAPAPAATPAPTR
jgi:hypothetical protein